MKNKSHYLMHVLMILFLFKMVGCSSSPKLEERDNTSTIKRDYEVRDASHSLRPGWIGDPQDWAMVHKQETNKYRFFSFETTPKVDRAIACDLAKANLKADIAGEIATFIDKSLGESREGQASIYENSPRAQELREFVEVTLASKVQALIHGARIVKTYWEKRQYLEKKGAKKDFIGFTCAVLVAMDNDRLKRAVDEAAEHVVRRSDDPETKENVKRALKDASENFVKAKQGML